MIRVNIVVEGQTEEAFVGQTLLPYFADRGIIVNARRVKTGSKRGEIFKGGGDNYEKIRNDIIRWTKEDKDAWITSMFDLYGIPKNFPGISEVSSQVDPYVKIANLERAFGDDIAYHKFIPYIQLHEFEAVLLSEPMKIMEYFIEYREACERLDNLVSGFDSPECINQSPYNAPSKRIIKEIPAYDKLKSTAGPLIAEAIGIDVIMRKCRHFSEWINKICEIKYID